MRQLLLGAMIGLAVLSVATPAQADPAGICETSSGGTGAEALDTCYVVGCEEDPDQGAGLVGIWRGPSEETGIYHSESQCAGVHGENLPSPQTCEDGDGDNGIRVHENGNCVTTETVQSAVRCFVPRLMGETCA